MRFFHKKCVRARGWCGVCEYAGECVWARCMAVSVTVEAHSDSLRHDGACTCVWRRCVLFEADGADDECYACYFVERYVEGRVFLVVGDGGEAVFVL